MLFKHTELCKLYIHPSSYRHKLVLTSLRILCCQKNESIFELHVTLSKWRNICNFCMGFIVVDADESFPSSTIGFFMRRVFNFLHWISLWHRTWVGYTIYRTIGRNSFNHEIDTSIEISLFEFQKSFPKFFSLKWNFVNRGTAHRNSKNHATLGIVLKILPMNLAKNLLCLSLFWQSLNFRNRSQTQTRGLWGGPTDWTPGLPGSDKEHIQINQRHP